MRYLHPSEPLGRTLLRLLNIKALQGEQPQLLTRQDRDDAHYRLSGVSAGRHGWTALGAPTWIAKYKNMRFQSLPDTMYLLTTVMEIEARQYPRMEALGLLVRPGAGGAGALSLCWLAGRCDEASLGARLSS